MCDQDAILVDAPEPYHLHTETSTFSYPLPTSISNSTEQPRPNQAQISHFPYTDFLKDLLYHSPEGVLHTTDEAGVALGNNTPGFWDAYHSSDDLPVLTEFSLPTVPEMTQLSFNQERAKNIGDDDDNADNDEDIGSGSQHAASAVGAQAFLASVWNWIPGPKDFRLAEEQSLALPQHIARQATYASPAAHPHPSLASLSLAPNDRERVLGVVLKYCDHDNLVGILSSFPSTELMATLVQVALGHQAESPLSWFHVPTFHSSQIRPELLAALVAYGAALTPIRALQRLGGAMPDVLLQSIIDVWASHNRHSRDVELLQTWALCLQIYYWSGSKRMMELGEGLAQPATTVLRRAGMLKRSSYQALDPTHSDHGAELEQKWYVWVQEETKIRLCHHLFVHNNQVSMTQFINPLMSYIEMTLPLPASDECWHARSALQWKDLCLKQNASRHTVARPSLASCVRDSVNHSTRSEFDPSSPAQLLTMYGIWGLVFEHRQFHQLMTENYLSDEPSCPALLVRHEMLAKTLAAFSISTTAQSTLTSSSANISTTTASLAYLLQMQEFLSMALHAPLQNLQSFAGKHGEDEAKRIFPLLQEWTRSKGARQSLWHAGQLLRHARCIPPTHRRGFQAATVYMASLVFWVYGIITRARYQKSHVGDKTPPFEKWQILLDRTLTLQTRKFLALGDGEPCISLSLMDESQGSTTTAPRRHDISLVQDAGATMSVAIAILKENMTRGRSDPFIESLTQLMSELAKAAQVVRL